ncbi:MULTISPECIES: hypothetical protein [unclassified Beijerinckia]|uniref:hypothetical protein n=1 Tax=unclassified Beijerinckia TaxID=2638183 RepID=UPI000B811505|nr:MULTISPECIES: hypothetical protein [unclassified Beijerinckia]MDH7794900.1 hypothetical protein [Beijerinckia sp. GAS462]
MIFTKEILRQVIAWSVLKASKSLGIIGKDEDESSLPENVLELISVSPNHIDALTKFATAYQDWYAFHLEIYKAGKSGNLSPSEETQLLSLIDRRDAARKALVEITS